MDLIRSQSQRLAISLLSLANAEFECLVHDHMLHWTQADGKEAII